MCAEYNTIVQRLYAQPNGIEELDETREYMKTVPELVKHLGKQGLWIRDLADPICLRACTHISSTAEELDALSNAIGTI